MQPQQEKLNVLLVDDHDLFREGLKLLLGQLKSELCFREAANLAGLHAVSREERIDVVLMDYHLPDSQGLEGVRTVRTLFETAMVVVISGEDNPLTIQQIINGGAAGFVSKSSSSQVLIAALQLVMAGGIYVPVEMLTLPASSGVLNGTGASDGGRHQLRALSLRQREVLLLALHGKSNKAIGRELGISDHTVKAHLSIAYRALGVNNRCEAVYAAAKYGLGQSTGSSTAQC